MKKIKFLLMTGFITSLLITSNSSIAMARDTNWTVGKTFSWAPYLNSTNLQNYSGKLQATANFKFDYVGEQHFNNSSINYFTFEINNESDGLLASTQYSNIPNPHYDWDDDNGDGYSEEGEVTCTGYLANSYNYYLTTVWRNNSGRTKSGSLAYVAQGGPRNPFNGEYEGYDYDLLKIDSYTVGY